MSTVLGLVRRVRNGEDVGILVDAIPYSRYLGISALRIGGDLICQMRYAPHLVGNSLIGALHGGTLGSLLESTAIFTLLLQADTLVVPKTVNITVEYLRSARCVDTFARAEFTKLGRRVANVRALAWQEERHKPVAIANAHFLLRPAPAPEDPPTTADPGAAEP